MNNPVRMSLTSLALVALIGCSNPAPPPSASTQMPPTQEAVSEDHAAPDVEVQSAVVMAAPQFLPPIDYEPYSEIILPSGVRIGEDSSDEDRKMVYDALKSVRALKFVYGDGSRPIVVFSDPTNTFDIGFFSMLDQNSENLNATVLVLPYSSDESAQSRALSIFCSANPEETWMDWMKAARQGVSSDRTSAGRLPEQVWMTWDAARPVSLPSDCTQAPRLKQISSLATRLGVSFTPTVVFAHGDSWPGPIVGRDDLEKVWWYVHGHLKVEG